MGHTRARSTVPVLIALALGTLVTACNNDGERGPGGATSAPPASSEPSPTTSPTRAVGPPDLNAPQVVATGISVPWGLAFLPDGTALVSQRGDGRILQVTAQGGAPREVYRVPGVVAGGEGGLLGLAVSPTHQQDRYVYAYFTAASDNRIVRFRLGEQGAPQVVFSGLAKASIHNGGRIAFGPDGLLYVGTGDANQRNSAQNAASPNGKILRLTAEGQPAPGNPTAGSPVYSLGHRNVQGLAWDAQGRLFAIEFGQNRLDEVNLIEPGRNYGWPQVEGTGADGRFTNPLVTWSTSEASPSGAAIAGNTLYVAALRGQRLWTVPLDAGKTGTPVARLQGNYGRLRTVAVAPDGALWLTTSNTDGRGNRRSGDDRILRFPAT